VLAQFDPDAIHAAGADSVRRRELIARAMRVNGTRWDYTPPADGTRQYVR
jgi:Choline sulfatase enzyme C terminal